MKANQILAILILFVTSVASLASSSEDAVNVEALPLTSFFGKECAISFHIVNLKLK